jgi:hypothetical protein
MRQHLRAVIASIKTHRQVALVLQARYEAWIETDCCNFCHLGKRRGYSTRSAEIPGAATHGVNLAVNPDDGRFAILDFTEAALRPEPAYQLSTM